MAALFVCLVYYVSFALYLDLYPGTSMTSAFANACTSCPCTVLDAFADAHTACLRTGLAAGLDPGTGHYCNGHMNHFHCGSVNLFHFYCGGKNIFSTGIFLREAHQLDFCHDHTS